MDDNPIIKKYVPFIVKHVIKRKFPRTEKELIEFSQSLVKKVIKKLEPINKN